MTKIKVPSLQSGTLLCKNKSSTVSTKKQDEHLSQIRNKSVHFPQDVPFLWFLLRPQKKNKCQSYTSVLKDKCMYAQVRSHHTLMFQTHTHSRSKITYSHFLGALSVTAHASLLGLAEVVAEVVVAGWFGDDRCTVRNGNVLQIQEAELNLHREEDLQLTAHGLTAHLPTEQNTESVRPQAELTENKNKV